MKRYILSKHIIGQAIKRITNKWSKTNSRVTTELAQDTINTIYMETLVRYLWS